MGKFLRSSKPPVQKQFCIDGITVHYTKKRVKNINLRLAADGQSVKVSAPTWVPEAQVEAFVRSKIDWIEKQQRTQQRSLGRTVDEQTPAEVAEYKRQVMEKTPPLIAKWEAILGVKAQKLAYRNMTSRWGSCNPQTGRICINVQLARFPDECLEYIVVHELCHLIERGHGPRFKALMTQNLPDWQSRRNKLRTP